MHDTRKATRSTPAPQDTARTSPAPLPCTWRTRPGVPTLAERAAIRNRLHGIARPRPQPRPQPRRQTDDDAFIAWLGGRLRAAERGVCELPRRVRTDADAVVYRADLRIPLEPRDHAQHARMRAEWRRRDGLTPTAGRAS